ncbi:MAG: hypothetical protein OSJ62_04530 [Lachnospiraceae bacterium]|nr:hypothetical protein [Lachnospiraceae bacterium]
MGKQETDSANSENGTYRDERFRKRTASARRSLLSGFVGAVSASEK